MVFRPFSAYRMHWWNHYPKCIQNWLPTHQIFLRCKMPSPFPKTIGDINVWFLTEKRGENQEVNERRFKIVKAFVIILRLKWTNQTMDSDFFSRTNVFLYILEKVKSYWMSSLDYLVISLCRPCIKTKLCPFFIQFCSFL